VLLSAHSPAPGTRYTPRVSSGFQTLQIAFLYLLFIPQLSLILLQLALKACPLNGREQPIVSDQGSRTSVEFDATRQTVDVRVDRSSWPNGRPKRGSYKPRPETVALLKVSGNPITGLGETTPRRPSPFFWHPPDQHPYGELQIVARQSSRGCPGSPEAFQAAYNYPELVPFAAVRNDATGEQLADQVKSFALSHEADDVGIAPMDPLYVFEGYTVNEPWIIVLALAHNYERLKEVPSDETNGIGVVDVGDQYARGTRSSYALANWIRSQGYSANPYPGPSAGAVVLIPPAIASARQDRGLETTSTLKVTKSRPLAATRL
jgi:hypothetical protein